MASFVHVFNLYWYVRCVEVFPCPCLIEVTRPVLLWLLLLLLLLQLLLLRLLQMCTGSSDCAPWFSDPWAPPCCLLCWMEMGLSCTW